MFPRDTCHRHYRYYLAAGTGTGTRCLCVSPVTRPGPLGSDPRSCPPCPFPWIRPSRTLSLRWPYSIHFEPQKHLQSISVFSLYYLQSSAACRTRCRISVNSYSLTPIVRLRYSPCSLAGPSYGGRCDDLYSNKNNRESLGLMFTGSRYRDPPLPPIGDARCSNGNS